MKNGPASEEMASSNRLYFELPQLLLRAQRFRTPGFRFMSNFRLSPELAAIGLTDFLLACGIFVCFGKCGKSTTREALGLLQRKYLCCGEFAILPRIRPTPKVEIAKTSPNFFPNSEKAMTDIEQINKLHRDTVDRWHREPIDNPFDGLEATICKQHSFNFQLWHQEDIARSQLVSDSQLANVKRTIDSLNQQRNDWVEKVDDEITAMLKLKDILVSEDTPLNTETPGSAIDRLSIMSLRVYHLREQLDRTDVDNQHRDKVKEKLAICLVQQADLSRSLQELLDDIFAGKKRHRTNRQNKMYNDPTLNPRLYAAPNCSVKKAA